MNQNLKSVTQLTQFKEVSLGFVAFVAIVSLTIWLNKDSPDRPPKSFDELASRVERAGMFVSHDEYIISKVKITKAEARSVPITSDWKGIVIACPGEWHVVGGTNAFAWGSFVLTGDRDLIDEITKLPE